jgi:hypothetical protein
MTLETYSKRTKLTEAAIEDKWRTCTDDELKACLLAGDPRNTIPTTRQEMLTRIAQLRFKPPSTKTMQLFVNIMQAREENHKQASRSRSPRRGPYSSSSSDSRSRSDTPSRRGHHRSKSPSRSRGRSRNRGQGSRRPRRRQKPRSSRASSPSDRSSTPRSYASHRRRRRFKPRRSETSSGEDSKPESDKLETLILDFAKKHNIKKSTVKRLARGDFTYLFETTPGTVSIGAGIASGHDGQAFFTTTAEKKSIPANSQDILRGGEVLLEGRQVFSTYITASGTSPLNGTTIRVTNVGQEERPYLLFLIQLACAVLTPMGVHIIDTNIRQFCAARNFSFWPIPHECSATLFLVATCHRKNTINFCSICGDPTHKESSCPVRDIFIKSTKKKNNPPAPKAQPGAQQVVFQQTQLCQRYMSKAGKCNAKKCVFSHDCAYCGKKKQHAKGCQRP